MRYLPKLFSRFIQTGRLILRGPEGYEAVFGDQTPTATPKVALRLTDPAWEFKILRNPELRFAEAYMEGILVIEEGDVADLVALFYKNKRQFDMTPIQIFWSGVFRGAKRLQQHNGLARSRRNVASHYDLGDDLYKLFLDEDMQYSCAYFPTGLETLDEAQRLKKRHITAKLLLKPGQRVLDIGCGWGGLALTIAQAADVEVLGVTLSENQHAEATKRAQELGLADRVRFDLRDYRDVTEKFDRVVSVGMMEHVGAPQLPRFMLSVRDKLGPGGLALIHSIITKAPPGVTGPFIRKYIFPGGYSPAVSEVFRAVEKSGLFPLDAEFWRMHYALTLDHWAARFAARRDEAEALYDARFCRMWELYLAAASGAFRHGSNAVLQLQLGRDRDAAPFTRDYIAEETARIAAREA